MRSHWFILACWVVVATLALPTNAATPPGRNFIAQQMSGAQEVPPRATVAQGVAVFNLNPQGTELRYHVTVTRITNVFAAHIHSAAVGVNGPIVVDLFSGSVGSGPHNGVLAKGTVVRGVTNLPGSLAGANNAERFDALIVLLRSGNSYVNVHTNDGVAPTNTGPGDFPGGEIRGQIAPRP